LSYVPSFEASLSIAPIDVTLDGSFVPVLDGFWDRFGVEDSRSNAWIKSFFEVETDDVELSGVIFIIEAGLCDQESKLGDKFFDCSISLFKVSKFSDRFSDLVFLFEVLSNVFKEGRKAREFNLFVLGMGRYKLFGPLSCFDVGHKGEDKTDLAFVIVIDLLVDLKVHDASLKEPSCFGSVPFER